MATTTTMSGAAFDQLPYVDGRHLELLHGEVIELSTARPRHQRIVSILSASLEVYFDREPIRTVLPHSEFALGAEDRLAPDLAILLGQHWNALDPDRTPIPGAPDIAVEVISPSELAKNTMSKVWTYLAAGTREVWQLYSETERVQIYRDAKSSTVLDTGDILQTPLLPGWQIPVAKVFLVKRQS